MTKAKTSPTMFCPTLSVIISLLSIATQCDAFGSTLNKTTNRMPSSTVDFKWSSPRWHNSQLHSSTVDAATSSASSSTQTTDKDDDENITTRDLLSLDYIRSTLIRQEETIIFALIERSQFRQNDIVYKVGGVPGLGAPPGSRIPEGEEAELSFLDFMLVGTVSVSLCSKCWKNVLSDNFLLSFFERIFYEFSLYSAFSCEEN